MILQFHVVSDSWSYLVSPQGAITIYSTRELISDRAKVEEDLYKAVRERLGGTCCQTDCKAWAYGMLSHPGDICLVFTEE